MSDNLYSVDTSALVDGMGRYYRPSVFHSLWQRIDGLIEQGRLFATEEVEIEIGRKADHLTDWCGIELVTNAWKRLPVMDKILRVQKVLDKGLTPAQKDTILRVSVLTPEEEKEFMEAHPRVAKSRQRRSRGAADVTGKVRTTGTNTVRSARRRITS